MCEFVKMISRVTIVFIIVFTLYIARNQSAPIHVEDVISNTPGNESNDSLATTNLLEETNENTNDYKIGHSRLPVDVEAILSENTERKGDTKTDKANENGSNGPLAGIQQFVTNLTSGGNNLPHLFGPNTNSGMNPVLLLGTHQSMLIPMNPQSMMQGMTNLFNGAQFLNNLFSGK